MIAGVGRCSRHGVLALIHLRRPKVFNGFHTKAWTPVAPRPFQCWEPLSRELEAPRAQHWKGSVGMAVQILMWKPSKTFGPRKWIRSKTTSPEYLPTRGFLGAPSGIPNINIPNIGMRATDKSRGGLAVRSAESISPPRASPTLISPTFEIWKIRTVRHAYFWPLWQSDHWSVLIRPLHITFSTISVQKNQQLLMK